MNCFRCEVVVIATLATSVFDANDTGRGRIGLPSLNSTGNDSQTHLSAAIGSSVPNRKCWMRDPITGEIRKIWGYIVNSPDQFRGMNFL